MDGNLDTCILPYGALSGTTQSAHEPISQLSHTTKSAKKLKFDKEGHLLIRQGHPFRKDHLKIYKIHAALKGTTQQELLNTALEYYKVNVLQKSQVQKLKEPARRSLIFNPIL